MKTLITILMTCILAACGGGDPEPGDKSFIGPPNCEGNPDLCK